MGVFGAPFKVRRLRGSHSLALRAVSRGAEEAPHASVLSFVRLHKVQGMMDLRQALEADCAAAFAIANPEDDHFF